MLHSFSIIKFKIFLYLRFPFPFGWLIDGKQPTSIGLLSMQNGVAGVIYSGTIAGYQVAAVSREPGPTAGKNVPAGPVVVTGAVKEPTVVA